MATLESMQQEIDRLKEKMNFCVCAFCAKEYPKGQNCKETAEAMAKHMAECVDHPMRTAVLENMWLKIVLRNILVETNFISLEAARSYIREALDECEAKALERQQQRESVFGGEPPPSSECITPLQPPKAEVLAQDAAETMGEQQ